jgi:hypothetical protein
MRKGSCSTVAPEWNNLGWAFCQTNELFRGNFAGFVPLELRSGPEATCRPALGMMNSRALKAAPSEAQCHPETVRAEPGTAQPTCGRSSSRM